MALFNLGMFQQPQDDGWLSALLRGTGGPTILPTDPSPFEIRRPVVEPNEVWTGARPGGEYSAPSSHLSGGGEPTDTWGGPVQGYGDITKGAPTTAGMKSSPTGYLPFLKPGSVLDNFIGTGRYPQSGAEPNEVWGKPAPQVVYRPPQPQTPAFDGAEPSEVWTGGGVTPAPATQNIPMPRPRPDPAAFGPNMTQNAPSDVGYQYGPGGQQAWSSYGNDILPQNATLTQGTVAPQMQAPSPGMFERLQAGASNLTTGGNPIAGILNSISGLATGQRTDPSGVHQANQQKMMVALHGALVKRGVSSQEAFAIASAAATDPKLAETLLPQALGLKPPTTMEGHYAEQAHRAANGGGGGVNTGGYLDYVRQKNAAEKAGTTEGERVANAQLDLPSAVAQSKEALRLVDELRKHKGRDGIGWHGYASNLIPDTAIPGNTEAFDANRILKQLKGGAFLEAFKSLKGGGQITEVEGTKATDALARMDRASSRAEFDKALSDYEGVIRIGIDRANQVAGKEPPDGFKGNSEWKALPNGVRIRQVR